MNHIFISYAGDNYNIAKELEKSVNSQISSSFSAELVEERREGDTTFTEKVIKYFRKCNVFIVIITEEALKNQFVNQEWGYAKCLKEFGQIQVLLHILEKNKSGERIKSNGFISTNMDYIEVNKEKCEVMIMEVINFLKIKEGELIPIIPETIQKLNRASIELDKNIELRKELIESEPSFRTSLSMNPKSFHYDYALQILQVGYLFPINFSEKIELYVDKIKEINIWKGLARDWAICRGNFHEDNTNKFYEILNGCEEIFNRIKQATLAQKKIFES